MIPQLDTVIIEVSSVKGLSLRGDPLGLYRAKQYQLIEVNRGRVRVAIIHVPSITHAQKASG